MAPTTCRSLFKVHFPYYLIYFSQLLRYNHPYFRDEKLRHTEVTRVTQLLSNRKE